MNAKPQNMNDFLKEYPNLKDFYPFLGELNKESDRGKVLISCCYLEEQLGEIINAFLVRDGNTKELLFGFNAPLGSFSSRILMAFSLGLISRDEYEELTRIRKIRNEFAHNVHVNFTTPKVMDLVNGLDYAAKDYGEVKVDVSGKYTTSVVAIILNLVNRPHYVSEKRLSHQAWPY